jgi:prepilin-type N-terminal cleavage/methylation domain-containing protein
MLHYKKQGFTLIELLIVISIIVILAMIVIFNVLQAATNARNSKRASDVNTIATAITLYFDGDNSPRLPLNVSNNGAGGTWCGVGQNSDSSGPYSATCLGELVRANYLATLPQNPACEGAVSTITTSFCYGYYNYGNYVTVGTEMEPADTKYGPFPDGWNCSNIVATSTSPGGWWTGMGPIGITKEYCAGFLEQ